MDNIAFATHDHHACIKTGLEAVAEYCTAKKLQFTPVRRRALEILLHEHRAMGAYDVLDHLRRDGLGSQPPVAYRALDFLVSHGFAHKIERLNAFIACARPGQDHTPAFLICRHCDAVAEAHLEPSHGRLNRAAQDTGFTIEQAVVEALGLCPNCAPTAPKTQNHAPD